MATAIANVATPDAAAARNTEQLHSAGVAKAASKSVGAAGVGKDDTVKISLAASIKLMHHQGLSDSIIASRVGMSVKEVDSYLPGSTQTTSTAVVAGTASSGGAAGGSAAAKAASDSSSGSADTTASTSTDSATEATAKAVAAVVSAK